MKKICIVILVQVLFLLQGCNSKIDDSFEKSSFGMGTVISQKIYGENKEQVAEEVLSRIKYIEELMTINALGGDVNSINANAGSDFVKIDLETFGVIKNALKFSKLSDGAFDITCGPVSKSWGIGTKNARIPKPYEISELQSLVNYNDITLKEENKSVFLAKKGQMIDLGAIAKGYAGDEAIKIYKKNGIDSAFINIGGNVVALGSKSDEKPWIIGIQNPRAVTGNYIGTVKVANKTLVTSGDYERYFEKDGKRYHHIFDPKTGRPSESDLMSVTIIADSSMDADALSTSVFVLGFEKGLQLIKKYKQAEAVFITTDKKVYITEGLKGLFTFTDESEEYKYVQ